MQNITFRKKTYGRLMGRFTSLLMVAVIIFNMVTIPSEKVFAKTTSNVGVTESGMALVYAHSEYKISLRNAVYASGGKDDGKMLTDTLYSSVEYDNGAVKTDGWVVIQSYDGEADYRVTVTVDFGYTAEDVSLFFVRTFCCAKINAAMPYEIKYYVSQDGDNYEYVGVGTTTTDTTAEAASAVYRLNTSKGYTARYVRVVLNCTGGTDMYINEFGAAAEGNVFYSNSESTEDFSDSRGVSYRIIDDVAEVTGINTKSVGGSGTVKPSTSNFNEDGIQYVLGKGSSNPVTVYADFIGEGRVNYSGIPNNINYIVIHNTGTTDDETDADRYNSRMHNTTEEKSWHYTVDSEKIYHSLADNIVGWHAGSTHNYQSLGIEICTNGAPTRSSGAFIFSGDSYDAWVESTFRPALKNAAMLTAELLTRYGLGTDAVIQHYDVTEKNCPLWLRYKNGRYVNEGTLWVEFMGYVEDYYLLLNGTTPKGAVGISSKIVLPDYIDINGDVYPVARIGENAFASRGNTLRSVTISKNVNKISITAFESCESTELIIAEGNDNFTIDSEGVLHDVNGNIIFDPLSDAGEVPSPKDGCGLDIRENSGRYYIFCNEERYTLKEIAEEYGASEYSAVALNGDILESEDIPGTGTVISTDDGAKLYMVLKGDMNGDTKIDAFDYLMLKNVFFDKYFPSRAQALSVKFSSNDKLDTFDYLILKSHVLGKYNIFE